MGLLPTRSSLAGRLRLALATMLLPVAAVAAAGLVTFRQSISALEESKQRRSPAIAQPATGWTRSTTTSTRRRGSWPICTRSTATRSRTRSRHCGGGSRTSCWPVWPRSFSAPRWRCSWLGTWAARSRGRDDLSYRVPVSGDDELAQLGTAFNAMAGSLDESRAGLRESEQRFRALVHHASDVFTVIGADAVIRYQSPSIAQVLGYRTEDLIGRSFLDLIDPDHREVRQSCSSNPGSGRGSRPLVRSACGPAGTSRRRGASR
jgi:hypothetical protein